MLVILEKPLAIIRHLPFDRNSHIYKHLQSYGNGMVTLFKHGISFRYTFIEKTNFLTSLKTKIKEIKLIKMKRKHLLFKEAVCKNRISLVKLFINQNLCLLIFP